MSFIDQTIASTEALQWGADIGQSRVCFDLAAMYGRLSVRMDMFRQRFVCLGLWLLWFTVMSPPSGGRNDPPELFSSPSEPDIQDRSGNSSESKYV